MVVQCNLKNNGMGIWNWQVKEKESSHPKFNTGKQAFEWAFQFAITEGKSPLDAAKEAAEFNTIICERLGLPQNIEPEKKGFDKWEAELEKWDRGCQKFTGKPISEVALLAATLVVSGAGAGAIGALTESKIEHTEQKNYTVEDGGTI